MITLGYKERFNLFLKYKKIFISLFFVFAGLLLADAVVFIILVTYENFKSAYFINLPICIIISLCFAFSIACISFFKKEIKFLENLFTQYLNLISGKVISISNQEITIKGRKILEVRILDDKEEIAVYYETSFGEIPFKENNNVSLKISDNFILEYKVESL